MNSYLIATQQIKDLLHISNFNNSGTAAGVGGTEGSPGLPSSTSVRKISNVEVSRVEAINLIDLEMSGQNVCENPHVPLNNSVPNEVLERDGPSGGMQLFNNCTLVVPEAHIKVTDEKGSTVTHIKVWCPAPGQGDVSHCTNSNFCKTSKLIDYQWKKTENVNLLAVCRTKPLIAYVIDISQKRGIAPKRDNMQSTQILRLFNYEKPDDRVKASTSFSAPVADIAFPYLCMERENENKLAVVDKRGNINIFSYKYCGGATPNEKSSVEKILEIVVDNNAGLNDYVRLTWCPFVPLEDEYESDCGMRLAVACGTDIEIFSIDKLSEHSIVTRPEVQKMNVNYRQLSGLNLHPLVSLHLSNDASVLATASVDNSIKFLDVPYGNTDVSTVLHNWTPKLQGNDKISAIFFLDDYGYLLENSEHHFWASIFIGTNNGYISIWNLSDWLPVQKIYLECDGCSPDSCFRYKMDISASVIIATREDRAFVLLVDGNQEKDEADAEANNAHPLISKISRFQLYTPILSFVVKKQSNSEIDIFWITEKSLERCTIDVTQLIEKSPSEWSLNRPNNSSVDEVLKLDSTNKENSQFVSNILPNRYPPPSVAPAASLAQVFSKPAPTSEDQLEVKNKDPDSRRPSTPSSQEVANLLNSGREVSSPLYSWAVNLNGPVKMNADNGADAKPYTFPPAPVAQIPVDLVRQEQLKNLEDSILQRMDIHKEQICDDIKKLNGELLSTKVELKDVSQIKSEHFNKIINNLVKKLMDQMNVTFSKGLEEFMMGVKRELSQVSDQVQKLKTSFKNQCDIQKQQQTDFEKKMQEVNKQLQDCATQQKSLLQQLQQQITLNQSLAGAMSPAVRFHTPSSTPQPGSASTSLHYMSGASNDDFTMSPNLTSLHEALLRQQRAEEEQRKAQLKMQILSKISSKDDAVVLDGLIQALNLNDPALVNKVCQMFMNTPDELARIASKEQSALLSLLSQLANSDLKEEKWKVKFVMSIIMIMDMKSEVVRQNLSKFIKKLILKLEALHSVDKSDDKLGLMLLVLRSVAPA